ncbi:thioredoxin family protein [candidate division KSB1 bacterium]|nr:thioredoxin family protein [candidate division KSB1 bacterium]
MKNLGILALFLTFCFTLFAGENHSEKTETAVVDSIQTAKITFIELGSVKCIPCKMMQPVMIEIEKQYADTVKVVFYDVWTKDGKKYGQQYSVKVIPTQVFLDENGEEFFRHQGFFSKEEIEKLIDEQLKK